MRTGRISEGDLEYRVEVAAADELGVLVESFNRMTAELERSKQLLEESNRELLAANERLAEFFMHVYVHTRCRDFEYRC